MLFIKRITILSIIIIFLFEKIAFASISYVNMSHFDFASKKYQVSCELLLAIAKTESNFSPFAVNIQGKGYFPKSKEEALTLAKHALQAGKSFDVGLMQINVWWLKRYNISLETALDPQNNIILGAFVLKNEINRYGLNWKAIASYHTPIAKNPERAQKYAHMILQNLRAILAVQKTEQTK